MFEPLGAHGLPEWSDISRQGRAHLILLPKQCTQQSGWVSLFGLLHTASEGGLIREQCVFHIVHRPRFALLKLTFAIGTSDQSFGYNSLTMNFDPVELLMNRFVGNNRFEMHI